MWPGSYFAARYFAPRYFGKVGAAGGGGASIVPIVMYYRENGIL